MDEAAKTKLAELTLDIPAPRISEIVLRTSSYDVLKTWYQAVLGVVPFFEHIPEGWQSRPQTADNRLDPNIRLCFLRVHNAFPYSQVVALFDVAGLERSDQASGLHHMQFRHASLPVLFDRFERLRGAGIRPDTCFNHGPATSFYYADPDGNLVELSASNFDSEAAFLGYFATPAFQKNPAGIRIDPDDYLARHRGGEAQADLVRIPD
ncbi:MAG: VOC family protein [Sneathiellaceae bacterium]